MNNEHIKAIQTRIGYEFKNTNLLEAAFTHASYVNEHNATGNERIEFLGDCVLNFLVGEKLFMQDRTASEGKLSARRAAIVSRSPLARIVDELDLLQYLRVGVGVDKSSFVDKARSDLLEAVIGAVYLDGGMEGCRRLLDKIYYPIVKPISDYKSKLQEYIKATVEYVTESDGSGFRSVATVGDARFGGVGRSKTEAERNAALAALKALGIV